MKFKRFDDAYPAIIREYLTVDAIRIAEIITRNVRFMHGLATWMALSDKLKALGQEVALSDMALPGSELQRQSQRYEEALPGIIGQVYTEAEARFVFLTMRVYPPSGDQEKITLVWRCMQERLSLDEEAIGGSIDEVVTQSVAPESPVSAATAA